MLTLLAGTQVLCEAVTNNFGETFCLRKSNPPYVRQEQLSADKPFFQDRYEVYHGVADLFVYFFAQGLRLLRKNGRLAYGRCC